MRTKLAVLAVAALLALGTGSVVAAMDTPTADTASDDALPANYTVDVTNPGEMSDEEVDQAIETAWANQTVRSYFDEVAAVHFEVWASGLDENVIHVKVAPIEEPDETRVITDVNLSTKQVTDIDESVKLNASNAITIDATDYDLNDTEHGQHTNIERGGDGTFTFEVEDDDETTTTVPSEEIIRIDLPPENQTVNGE